jgi:RNA polymerase sigma-70 factor (ECF subfamily)
MLCGNSEEILPSFSKIVENVQSGKAEGLEQLYRVFRILSASLRRRAGHEDFEDRLHDTFIVVVEAIREGKLREPGALPSYIHGVARLSVCAKIGVKVRHERLSSALRYWVSTQSCMNSPEDAFEQCERSQIVEGLLGAMSGREREILTRFYIREQTKEQICDEMHLTETQFRLAKSRAKQRLSRMGQHQFSVPQMPVPSLYAAA